MDRRIAVDRVHGLQHLIGSDVGRKDDLTHADAESFRALDRRAFVSQIIGAFPDAQNRERRHDAAHRKLGHALARACSDAGRYVFPHKKASHGTPYLIETLFQWRAKPPRAGTGAAPEDASYTLSFTKSYTTWAEYSNVRIMSSTSPR